MLSTKPYLIRAFYDWIIDSEHTPYIAVNANFPRCNVPEEYIENGEIVFNISPEAVRDFKVVKEFLEFRASFSGVIRVISVPVQAILAIYAEENGQGMFFDAEEEVTVDTGGIDWVLDPSEEQGESVKRDKKKTSHLRLVE